jgi:hypothetical protein
MLPVTRLGQDPLAAGIFGPEPVVVTWPLLLPDPEPELEPLDVVPDPLELVEFPELPPTPDEEVEE